MTWRVSCLDALEKKLHSNDDRSYCYNDDDVVEDKNGINNDIPGNIPVKARSSINVLNDLSKIHSTYALREREQQCIAINSMKHFVYATLNSSLQMERDSMWTCLHLSINVISIECRQVNQEQNCEHTKEDEQQQPSTTSMRWLFGSGSMHLLQPKRMKQKEITAHCTDSCDMRVSTKQTEYHVYDRQSRREGSTIALYLVYMQITMIWNLNEN